MNWGIRLESPRLILRDLRHEDLEQIESWRPFTDPLSRLWNIPRSTRLSRELWFTVHDTDPTRLWLVIERKEDGQVIGTLSLREIVRHISARLGITLGADYVEQGYGSEALRLFLPYYFRELDFRRMFLDVAAANRRAVHVYEKLGFRRTGSHYRDVPEGTDLHFLEQEQYRSLRPYFRRHLGRVQLLFYDMVLERSDWEKANHL
ncbi:MAG: GNAT family N-acetyltransferase [Chloroflexi bacterium]|nr:GNAT family N-acetyltransferase [Chloroflexota bacterium]